jgi:hypothetical protein
MEIWRTWVLLSSGVLHQHARATDPAQSDIGRTTAAIAFQPFALRGRCAVP